MLVAIAFTIILSFILFIIVYLVIKKFTIVTSL